MLASCQSTGGEQPAIGTQKRSNIRMTSYFQLHKRAACRPSQFAFQDTRIAPVKPCQPVSSSKQPGQAEGSDTPPSVSPFICRAESRSLANKPSTNNKEEAEREQQEN
jgi:hypothetical protein